MSQQSQRPVRGRPRRRSGPSDWGVLSFTAVGAAGLVIALATIGPGSIGPGDPPTVTDASSPGPLELAAAPPPALPSGRPPAPDDPAGSAHATAEGEAVAGVTRTAFGRGSRRPSGRSQGDRSRRAGAARQRPHVIAAVRRGRRVAVHTRPGGKVVALVGPRSEFGSPHSLGVTGRRGRWLRVTTPISTENRDLWIKLSPAKLRLAATDLSIHASLSERVVELRRNERVVRRFAVTIGAPGSSTPSGRFAVTDTIVGGLNPVYGCCAIALSAHQPNLPPGWIGGDRVAIHGTDAPIGHAASSGCLRATDEDVRALIAAVPLGTPVFIRE